MFPSFVSAVFEKFTARLSKPTITLGNQRNEFLRAGAVSVLGIGLTHCGCLTRLTATHWAASPLSLVSFPLRPR